VLALWVVSANLLGACIFAAAWMTERALRLVRRDGRAPWIAALAITFTWPILAAVLVAPSADSVRLNVGGTPSFGPIADVDGAVNGDAFISSGWLSALDQPLLWCWAIVTLVMLTRLALSAVAVRRLQRTAHATTIGGVPVLISEQSGPAVFGGWRSHIVLPSWIFELDGSLRDLVLRHEGEHARARDPLWLLSSLIACALMPWSVALWWMARRLRIAAELDCDARVLAHGTDVARYGQLLLLIAQRQAHEKFAPMMAGTPSSLATRIAAMNSARPSRPVLRASILILAAAASLTVAASPRLARALSSIRALTPVAPPTVSRVDRMQIRELPTVTVAASLVTPAPTPIESRGNTKAPMTARTDVMRPDTRSSSSKTGSLLAPEASSAPAAPVATQDSLHPATIASGSPMPRYPNILKTAGLSGVTVIQVVVDSSGRALPATLKVVRTSHELFANAVRNAIGELQFTAPRAGQRKVRQLVEIHFLWEIAGSKMLDSTASQANLTHLTVTISAAGNP
jgi:beta-lactamase regulating signal transducer with metallopeptidase domain